MNVISRTRNTLMPRLSTITAPPRRLRIARPSRDCSRLAIANIANGPSGLAYNPGTALSDRFKGKFFLSDFRGSAGASVVHEIALEPQGAFFKLKERRDAVQGILTTDVDFGVDGAMYVLDWVETWGGAALRYDAPGHPSVLVWNPFPQSTRYFAPSTREFMLDLAVDDLDAIVAKLKAKGVAILKRDDSDPDGDFAWILDPDGTKIELWQSKPHKK